MTEDTFGRHPTEPSPARSAGPRPVGLDLAPEVADAMRTELPRVAGQVVNAVRAEVPSYADPFSGRMGQNIEVAVALALGGFLDLALGEASHQGHASTGAPGVEASSGPFTEVFDAAYALGRGEARAGRSMNELLSAYRVGARVSWRDLSAAAVGAGVPGAMVAHFAELVFAYIDELSAASAAGHADELATTGRVRERYLERLAQALVAGAAPETLIESAGRAEWAPPPFLTAVLLPASRVRGALSQLDAQTLGTAEPVPGLESYEDLTVLLVPSRSMRGRSDQLRALADREAVVGPARPWTRARSSFDRAVQALTQKLPRRPGEAFDTEQHLSELILSADLEALADLRAQVLAPLADLRPAAAEKLSETLRSWLLHQGRRDDIAAELFVHPQTVRYRLTQLRELYGDRLEDPHWVLRLTVALGVPGPLDRADPT